ncbi:MAG: Beta-peptidyl aminopeptidase BapA [Firmicutes bacterium]|nr:Beta-peptidyl aminopeptidase BapA [candidate division NPL-UPA2 bacterium]
MNSYPKPRPRELGLVFGTLPTGERNAITDVPEVLVGHVDVVQGEDVRTGVTVILPHADNIFRLKVEAAVYVINGFGKAAGVTQIEELGVLETPIAVTNTLSVPAAIEGLIEYSLKHNPEIGTTTGTVNAVVGECNDGHLNDIRGRHVKPTHVAEAIADARGGYVPEGDVGAGKGMVCFGYKGGIGTSSRLVGDYTLGCLVLTNFGRKEHLTILGRPIGRQLATRAGSASPDGSVIIVLATNAPLDARQLLRLARRGGLGLARVGSVVSHGSGDYVFAFSTANKTLHFEDRTEVSRIRLNEGSPLMTTLFQATVESIEEAVVNSLFAADTVVGLRGRVVQALPVKKVLELLRDWRV